MQQSHYKGRRIEEHDLNGHTVHVYFNEADRDRILVPKLDNYLPIAQAAAQGYVVVNNLGDATDLIDKLDEGKTVTLNKLTNKPA